MNERPERRDSDGDRGGKVRLVVGWILAILLVAFVLANTTSVSVNFLAKKVEMPLIIVLVVTALVGAAIGGLLMRHLRRPAATTVIATTEPTLSADVSVRRGRPVTGRSRLARCPRPAPGRFASSRPSSPSRSGPRGCESAGRGSRASRQPR